MENTCDISESVRFAPLRLSHIFYKLMSPRQATRQRRRFSPFPLTLEVASSPLAGRRQLFFVRDRCRRKKPQNDVFISPVRTMSRLQLRRILEEASRRGGGVSPPTGGSATHRGLSLSTYSFIRSFFVGWIPFFLSTGRISSQKKLKCSSSNLEPSLCRYFPCLTNKNVYFMKHNLDIALKHP